MRLPVTVARRAGRTVGVAATPGGDGGPGSGGSSGGAQAASDEWLAPDGRPPLGLGLRATLRDRRFWTAQMLVAAALAVAYGVVRLDHPSLLPLAMLPAALPIWYAAVKFGIAGSLPTSAWAVTLLLLETLGSAGAGGPWAELAVAALLVVLAAVVGREAEMPRLASHRAATSGGLLWMSRVADQLPDGVCVTEPSGVIQYVNQTWARLMGLSSPEDARGRTLAALHSGHRGGFHPGPEGPRRSLHLAPDGRKSWLEVTSANLTDRQGGPWGTVAVVRDVTAQVRSEDQVREAEQRFRIAFEQAPEGMAVVSPQGDFIQVNRAFTELVGRSEPELKSLGLVAITHPDDLEETRRALNRETNAHFVKRLLLPDGHPVTVRVTQTVVWDGAGAPRYFVAQYRDVTADERTRRELVAQAFHDPLTRLPNRLLFQDRAERGLARARRRGVSVALLFCDLDRFKAVNDRLGHLVGDQVLRLVAARLVAQVREHDTVARLGGDEFVLVLEELGREPVAAARDCAQRVLAAMEAPLALPGVELPVSLSVGIAVAEAGDDALDLDEWVRRADTAMYRAKAAGGGSVRVFSASEASSQQLSS
ncbi:MAG: diguanylate cyclase [Candidatus Dormiibacterota bacterium]